MDSGVLDRRTDISFLVFGLRSTGLRIGFVLVVLKALGIRSLRERRRGLKLDRGVNRELIDVDYPSL